MAVSIDWGTRVITVLQADMTPLGGDVYELDIDWFRLQLKDLEDDEYGMPMPDTHRHNTEVTISGVTYARTVEIINGYTVTVSPASAYQVSCVGANHNVQDVYNNLTGPTLLPNNSAGLIDTGTSDIPTLRKLLQNRLITDPVAGTITVYDDDDVSVFLQGDLWEDAAGTIPYQGSGSERRDKMS